MLKQRILAILSLLIMSLPMALQAQGNAEPLQCGDNVSGVIAHANEEQSYSIKIASGTILNVHADSLPLIEDDPITIEIFDARGSVIQADPYTPSMSANSVETGSLLGDGNYEIVLSSPQAGAYQLFTACVDSAGQVTSGNNLVQGLTCGDQVDNLMMRASELNSYYIALEKGDALNVFLESLYGQFGAMTFEIGLYSPDNQELDRISEMFKDVERHLDSNPVNVAGIYRLYVQGFDGTGEDYRLSLGCTLADGTVIEASSSQRRVLKATILQNDAIPSVPETPVPLDDSTPPVITPASADRVLDLIEGIPNTGQINSDSPPLTWRFEGMQNQALSLHFVRLKGNLNLFVTVLDPDNQAVVGTLMASVTRFDASMILPKSGEYHIQVARTDLLAAPVTPENTAFTLEVTK